MAHPAKTAFVRMLRRWKASPEVIEAAENLKCSVCDEIRRPRASRKAVRKRATRFNEFVAYDEYEVVLSDNTRKQLVLIIDEASNYVVAYPLEQVHTAKWEYISEALERGWVQWAGAPDNLVFDPMKPHISEAAQQFCDRHGMTPMPSPAEDHDANAVAESRIGFWKAHFIKVNEQLQITKDDDPWVWSNKHLRYGGFSKLRYSGCGAGY